MAIALLLALHPGLALPTAAAAQAGTWAVECVDCPKAFAYMTDRSLQLDADGHPHVAYGEKGLNYAWHDGTFWHYELVDDAPWTGSYASLALDAAGQPRISYQDSLNGNLKYASRSASGWQVETVHGDGDVGFYTSLALDAEGRPHISHAYSMGSVYYATKDDQGWHLENPASGFSASDTSVAIDAQGYPHIAFHNDDSEKLEYVYKDAYGWHRSVLIGAAYTSTSLSLVLDQDGEKHISYYDENGSALKYYYMGLTSVVDSQPGTIWGHSSIALNAAGRPRISYRDEMNGGLKFAYHDGSGWQLEIVDPGVAAGYFSSLDLDDSGRAHVTYMNGGALSYAVQDGQEWTIGVIDRGARSGGASSLALDAAGGAHIGYQETLSSDLRYAYEGPSGWQIETVDEAGSTGWSPFIALDSSGRPYIGYSDTTNHVVKVAEPASGTRGWAIEVVAPQLNTYLSLAVDGEDRPHVVYQGLTGLEYAYRGASGWVTETLGTQALNGQFPSLGLDGSGRPQVLYFDYQSWDNIFLKLAYRDEGGWQFVTVERVAAILGGAELALDGSDVPHIAYLRSGPYGALPHELVYGYREGAGWHLEVVDTEGTSPAMALDASGRPHIAYGNKYAYCDAGGWHVQLLPDQVGAARSLALDQAGRPHLTLGDHYSLRFATLARGEHAIYLPLVVGQ